MENNQKRKFNAEEFCQFFMVEGRKVSCDRSLQSFKETNLPEFYNEELFKRGQIFFHKHRFAVSYGMIFGLLSVLAVPEGREFLTFTRRSITPFRAYQRFMKTILHVWTWYDEDFTPNSRLWKSMVSVKAQHNAASMKSSKEGKTRISQYAMSATLILFMGYPLTQREKIGFYNVQEEEWKSFVHFWRVIGYLLGIEDRFNLCRESVEETRDICNTFLSTVALAGVKEQSKDYVLLAYNVVEGFVSGVLPILNVNMAMNLTCNLLETNKEKESPFKLTTRENIRLRFLLLIVAGLRFSIFRTVLNYLLKSSINMVKFWPFPAFFRFGYTNSQVSMVG